MPTEIPEEKVNEFSRRIGMTLIESGGKFVRQAFPWKKRIVDRTEIRTFLTNELGLAQNNVSLWDMKYHVLPIEAWLQIIELDIVHHLNYMDDAWDCDNFSFLASSRAAELYLVNTMMVSSGYVYVPGDPNNTAFAHAFNAIVADNKGQLELYFYEPMRNEYTKFTKGQAIVMGPWKYTSSFVQAF